MWNRHKSAISSEMVSGCYDSRGGTNITRTLHDVTLYVHCLSRSICSLHVFFFWKVKTRKCLTSETWSQPGRVRGKEASDLSINCGFGFASFGSGQQVYPGCRAVKGAGLRPLACWDSGFESRGSHGCLLLTLRWLMSYIYEAPILDVSRSHTTTQHSR